MKLVFVSVYLSPHQVPFCLQMQKHLGSDFVYVAYKPMKPERIALGYPDLDRQYPFVIRAYEDDTQKQQAIALITQADMVVAGGAPQEYLQNRLNQGKPVLYYSERLYKTGYSRWKWPVRKYRFYKQYGKYRNTWMLCASAYTAGDFAKTGNFRSRTYKWGYFPELKEYADPQRMIAEKEPASILWVGRMIDWKHPEYALELASRLKRDGYAFRLQMIGTGELEEMLRTRIEAEGLEDCVELLGSMSPEQVRSHMERSQIFLVTSNRQEGWGAVLNESMNSGCAVVAGSAIGAVPFLIRGGENGLIFENENVEDLYQKVRSLLDDPARCAQLGSVAYHTMTELWNAETAAERLLQFTQALLDGQKQPNLFEDGPCSFAPILKDK